MVDSVKYNDWFNKANSDLTAAKILLEYNGDNAIVAFHCQQAIEKAFKGFMLKHKSKLVEGHSLVYLCKKASEIEFSIKQHMKNCAFVNQFYIETRYPSDIPMDVDKSEAQECIGIAEEILERIAGKYL